VTAIVSVSEAKVLVGRAIELKRQYNAVLTSQAPQVKFSCRISEKILTNE
jgi:hypothetical protein